MFPIIFERSSRRTPYVNLHQIPLLAIENNLSPLRRVWADRRWWPCVFEHNRLKAICLSQFSVLFTHTRTLHKSIIYFPQRFCCAFAQCLIFNQITYLHCCPITLN
jgi:hypothetical protein